jgi:coenzyme F420-0:L-glutamate ligase/coenzyme F420-1:gamma-L-glutamate ligase
MGVIEVVPIEGMPEVVVGDAVGALVCRAAAESGVSIGGADVVVVSQKIVSKAEGRMRNLREVEPGKRARELAAGLGKDPGLVELILAESRSVLRAERGVLIVETVQGWICANAGVDASNVAASETVTLLPDDGDASARRIRAEIRELLGTPPAVVLADSFGRPWRVGQADVAIGCAGLNPLDDWRGRSDRSGRELAATEVAIADEVAAAADLARDKVSGTPAIVIRGLGGHITAGDGPGAAPLRRAEPDDLFR